jgi:hypothetical protein
MKFIVAISAVLFLGLIFISHAQSKAAPSFPASIYGTWKIYKLEEVGGHAGEKHDLAQKEIGKKIRFGRGTVSYDSGFLFFDPPCRRVSYTFEVHKLREYEAEEQGTLAFHGLNPAKDGQIQYVVLRCKGRSQYYFEWARGNQLAAYYDGWFFFLEKVVK